MRKLSLLFAAALMACVFQTAYAAEDAIDDDGPDFAEQAEFFHPGMRGPGPMGMWRGGRGHGPMMPGFHNGPGPERGRPGRGHRFGFDGGMHFGMMGPRFMDELELTADQRSKILDAATESFRERLELRWELADAHKKLRELNDADTPDYDAIVAANEELGAVKGKLDVARRKVADRFDSILTAEQREKIEQFREDKRPDREERRGFRGRDDRPGRRDPRLQRGPGPRR